MKYLSLLSLFCCAISLGLNSAHAATQWQASSKLDMLTPNVNVNFKFYDLEAKSMYELFQKIRIVGPAGQAGNKAAGKASYSMNWQLNFEKNGAQCRVGDGAVDIEIDIVVPRWLNVDSQSEQSQAHWQTYLGGLLDHESGHKDIVLKAADKLIDYIKSSPVNKGCAQLQQQIDKAGYQFLAQAKAESDTYDQRMKLSFK
ncbi:MULTISPECIES: DUF922 domain-containing protein [unclassified Motilimonas]|uniref:DUF922 domain-containing protein n=1 Tax=Motilimonas TaxID=1914248 RepID=UPI001E3A93F9|nr:MULTISPECIES: DUF922 domain-containing protein [unclassified Motilimonas]MCE0556746.1 DUF922 domain-containing Zn-dependent protease [Motilimonas sp. E26]MDO6526793.1 DUF922 domain-containing protein [Motilimonas sp. 1_MG-2023]